MGEAAAIAVDDVAPAPRPPGTLLTAAFFDRPVLDVASDLLDTVLVHIQPGGHVAGRIVETEAYAADTDAASHAYRGKTARNAAMFGPPGSVYLYRSYGIHHCLNVVTTHPGGPASAVLIRALEPVEGLEGIRARRPRASDPALLRGPGNVCQGMGIGIELNGAPLDGSRLGIYAGVPTHRPVVTTRRVGITRGVDFPWRFYLLNSDAVSKRDRAAETLLRAQLNYASNPLPP